MANEGSNRYTHNAVIKAPMPKNKIKTPGIINSSNNNTAPAINQITAAFDKTSIISFVFGLVNLNIGNFDYVAIMCCHNKS